jgi:type I restriction enzyme S subunit
VYGIRKLRELILELAVRGKLVPQDANDEPASKLLKRIHTEKAKWIAEGRIKKDKPLAAIADEEKPFELPNEWVWARLGEITNFGVTEKLNFISDETWVLDLEDIEKDTSKLLQKFRFSERRSLSDKNSFQAGDVLYGKLRPYLNKVIVADEDGVCTTEILPIRCYGSFDSHYFKVALKSPYFINYVNVRSYGMKMPRLGTEDGRKACFPLPPLAEQHRIVAKVDELMALCDQLETQHNNADEAHEKLLSHLLGTLTQSQNAVDYSANWQRIASHFDTLFTTEASIVALKQTLLQLAVMGKLVPQDPNDEPASELLKRIQAQKAKMIADGEIKKDKLPEVIAVDEKPIEMPKLWRWVRLGDLATQITDGAHHTPEYISDGVPFLSVKNLSSGHLDFTDTRFISLAAHADLTKRCNPELYDILLTKIGTTGIAVVIDDPRPFSIFVSVALIKLPKDLIDRGYLALVINSPFVRQQSEDGTEGVGNKNLVLRKINTFDIPLAPLAEQRRIVAKVDEMMALCDQLKTRITQANQLQQKLADVMVEQAA